MLPHCSLILAGLLCGLLVCISPARTADKPAPTDNSAPLFQPPRRPPVPEVKTKGWTINPIDHFIGARLEAEGLAPSPRAEKLRLLRRVTFDLTGLPATIEEQDAFVKDDSPEAYSKVVDRLLASPRYGERWATHWLDLVRYAETDGFKSDDLRPEAYKYRDYVIRAFNSDLPYDRFIRQQLAGDELEPENPDAIIATGFNRLYPDENNTAALDQRRQEILDDITDVTGLTFLGLTIGCARCHDHKYDPTTQADYYRLQSFFAAMREREDVPAADAEACKAYDTQLAAWEAATRDLRAEMDALIADKRAQARKDALLKFRTELQDAAKTPPGKRTPFQTQIALLAEKQQDKSADAVVAKLPADKKARYQELEKQLAAAEPKRPEPLPHAHSVSDIGRDAPPTFRLQGGDLHKPKEEVQPSFPVFLGGAKPDTTLPEATNSTGRRSALARWLTQKDHPLTARVMVNRLWQHHFGVGIVASSNDFGALGDTPTHPELLDWLAVEFVESGYSLKHMHRLMVLSATYCQDSQVDPKKDAQQKAFSKDRANHLLWHANRQRLEGEALRDALLSLSGELNLRMFGPSAKPKLPDKISNYAWKPDAKVEDQNRRSVYVFVKRNMRYPLFDAFDWPDLHNSCSRRANTTTAPQALLLLNGEFTQERAEHLGTDLLAKHGDDDAGLVTRAYRSAWGRNPTSEEVRLGVKFVGDQATRLKAKGTDSRKAAVIDFCHAVMNTNEVLYVD
jgi:Protein of unknown function (DUF1553)/Protein of unknown function (DUF1549)